MTSLTQQLDVVVVLYREQAVAAAKAEAEHKSARAKRILRARHEGDARSMAEAECVAEADDAIADLFSRRLITAAIADSTKQKILSLREQIGWERTQMANQRAADSLHATDRRVA